MLHEMNLHDSPFDMMASGKKIYELRLYDEKRRQISAGDEIIFTRSRGGNDSIRCRVVALHLFDSFAELYAALPLLKCGYTFIEAFAKLIKGFSVHEKANMFHIGKHMAQRQLNFVEELFHTILSKL